MTFLDHAIGITGARTHDAPGQATITLTVAFVDEQALTLRVYNDVVEAGATSTYPTHPRNA